MDPANQQGLLDALVEFNSPALVQLIVHLRTLRKEQKIIERNLEEKRRAIQQLSDSHYINTHCYCPSCGAPPKRMRTQSKGQDEDNQPQHVRQSKL